MGPWSSHQKSGLKSNLNNRRYRLLLLAVFLLTAALLTRLFWAGVISHGRYLAMASNLHDVNQAIEPIRGRIFLSDPQTENADKVYPIATNESLITVYAVPSEIKERGKLTESLYEFFKKPLVEKETDDQLKAEEADRLRKELNFLGADADPNAVETVKQNVKAIFNDAAYLSAKQTRRQELIETKKAAIIVVYNRQLDRLGDTYVPLEKRVKPETAKAFHLSLVDQSKLPKDLRLDDLEIRYGRLRSPKVPVEQNISALDFAGINYEEDIVRVYPENGIAAHIMGYVAYDPEEKGGQFGKHGHYGLEGFFDDELFGRFGEVKSERGSGGLLIPNNRKYKSQIDGDDLILTIERPIQFFVSEKIKEAVKRFGARSGSVIVMEPATGAIKAMASYPDFDPNNYSKVEQLSDFNNPAVFDQYEPGSVFKAITMAAALNDNKVTPETTYNDTGEVMINGWPKPIRNSDVETRGAHGLTTMTGVLENSLNVGAIFAMRSIGDKRFAEYVKAFGFGEKTGIELEGESAGNISSLTGKKIKEISAATASFGQGLSVTPIQMVTAYAALVNGGNLVKPYLVSAVRHQDGAVETTKPSVVRNVLSSKASKEIIGMLVQVVEDGHSQKAKIPGYYIGGKTGTAQMAAKGGGYEEDSYNHTFISFGPAEQPKFVMLIYFNRPTSYIYADSTAVPLSREIMEYLLNYWQVGKTR